MLLVSKSQREKHSALDHGFSEAPGIDGLNSSTNLHTVGKGVLD